MPDITICTNDDCPMAKDCYRHEARPSEYWQSYGLFEPEEIGKCEHYLKLWKENNQ